ncbi:MAG: DNA mismatch repair protein MutS [Oscillospiraceae bacterium]|nr:DNA mismatch repair protein MutS [Oscillospiraceae bacterium]
MPELTPMMKQYFEIKRENADAILMFRLGDFYEMFFEDAKTASRELELVLTGRDCGQEERAPMCGVPFHSVDSYIARLVAKGYKVAICEQMEDPALAKGLVLRDVVRVITPGTVIENSMLDESKNNFLSCVFALDGRAGICFADISTGELHLTQLGGEHTESGIIDELGRFMPAEIIYNAGLSELERVAPFINLRLGATAELMDDDFFDPGSCISEAQTLFGEELQRQGIIGQHEALRALGAALRYLRETQKTDLANLRGIDFYSEARFMRLDASTRRNLELTESMRGREKRGSLLWALDRTKTPMGKRLMRGFVEQPVVSLAEITKRHNAVAELKEKSVARGGLRETLEDIRDMERLLTRIVYGTANAREIKTLEQTVRLLPVLREKLADRRSALLSGAYDDIDPLEDIAEMIGRSLVDEPPFSVREGGMVRDGFNAELDSLRAIVSDGKGFIAGIQAAEQEKTGIKKLKIGYNRVFGYYIEVSNSYRELVPDEYIRKQTLANCERYITQELKELEAKVLSAQDRITGLEYEIFNALREKIAGELLRIQKTARAVALVDVLCSLAHAAAQNGYVCPDMRDDGAIIIKNGRHPVVELTLNGAPFVPNDTELDLNENRCAIITGPNMAGKSTYMRQVALIVIMAQMGSFVPADAAQIGVVDSVFTRIGASDDLAAGQSTFMVEMSEVAAIIGGATRKSLIIYDEIGRGTSTFDGMSIARAVLEYSSDVKKLGAKTLFATHYHELTALENEVPGVKNYNIAVKKRGDEITFLRRIVRGGADGSYGIEVAKLAGVPGWVVNRARVILKELENQESGAGGRESGAARQEPGERDGGAQISFDGGRESELVGKLKHIDVNTLTPIEALSKLYELVTEAKQI